jgi:hypothetical protein
MEAAERQAGMQLHLHAVAGQNADEVLAHLARNNAKDFAIRVVQAQLEHRVGQRQGDNGFQFNRLTLGHGYLGKG